MRALNTQKLAPRFAVASAILFVTLVVMRIVTGASQTYFEVVHPPAIYASQILAHAGWLQIVVALDNVFIGAYVGAFAFGGLGLPRRSTLADCVVVIPRPCSASRFDPGAR